MGRGIAVRSALVAIFLPLLVSVGSPGDGRIRVQTEDVGVEATKGPNIDRKKARKVLTQCRKAYATIAKKFALNTSSIFFTGKEKPFWMRRVDARDPRIWALLEDTIRTRDMGAEAYLKRLDRGECRIFASFPGEDLTPDDLHRLWREMSYAVLAQTTWRACPVWLREGIAEAMGEIGADGEYALLGTLKETLRENADALQVGEVLNATTHSEWGRRGGRAVSWALVRMLEESNKKYLPSIYNQSRLLLNHLVLAPSQAKIRQEYTEVVLGQLRTSGVSTSDLDAALRAYIEADFPNGSAYRRTLAHKTLSRLKLPKVFGMGLGGRFASRHHEEDRWGRLHTYQPFSAGQASWRLPWPSNMQAWVGVRGKPGTNYALRPDRAKEGYYYDAGTWQAPKRGKQRLRAATMDLPRQLTKFGFIWVGVTSPHGLGYIFQKEYQLK